jgi:hypothetical protein
LGPHLAPIGGTLGDAQTGKKPSKINGVSKEFGEMSEITSREALLNLPYSTHRTVIQAKGTE